MDGAAKSSFQKISATDMTLAAASSSYKNNSESNKDLVCVLFIGNPGVGKSTLLNCLINQRNQDNSEKKIIFESGISFNTGLTKELHSAEINGHIYMDTPGLEDTKIRRAAAEAITVALQMGGRYQVVFVVTLEAGRVRPGDITTMNLVLESAKDISHYGVIFNKIGKRVFKDLTDENKAELTSQISLCSLESKPVPLPFFIQKSSDLDDESNAIADIDELDDYVNSILPVNVGEDNVTPIPIETYEEMKEKIENDLEYLKTNTEEMRKKIEEDAKTYNGKIAEAIARAEEDYEMKKKKLLQEQEQEISMMTRELEEIEELKKERNRMPRNQYPPSNVAGQTEGMTRRTEFNPYSNKRKLESDWVGASGYSHTYFQENQSVGLHAYTTNEITHDDPVKDLLIREAEVKKRLRNLREEEVDLKMEERRIKAAKNRNKTNIFASFCQAFQAFGDVVSEGMSHIFR